MSTSIAPGFVDAIADRYRVEAECGRGGTSIVYRARDLVHDRDVAIKVMRPELTSAATSDRFLREVRIAATLQHPHVAPLLDSGEAAGQLYCVLPFISGETLRQRLTREGPLPVADALRLAAEVGSALSYAHSQGVIHRDVKPENILLDNGHALLSDFGIARAVVVAAGDRLTDSGIAIGTPSYMSPEQATADSTLDERTDQYSLAVCLYEMLAGDPPFMGRTSQAVIARQMTEPPPRLEVVRPAVAPGVVAAIERGLSKVPADRYESIDAFLAAVEAADTALVRQKRRRTGWRAVAVGAVAVAAVVLWKTRPAPLDDARVVVFPARTSGTASDPDAGLRVADAIQVAVEHTEPLRWIPAWEDLDTATRRNPALLDATRARDLARRRRARYFVLSTTGVTHDSTRVSLFLHDARDDSLLAQASAADTAGGAPASALAIRALPRLLARMLDPKARVDLSPLTDRKLPAIVRLLEAEEAYRTARFAAAFDRYREAVAEDSLFAYAALKGAQAASWQNRLGEAIDLIRRARASERLLPPKYRPYLRGIEAYLEGRADSAVTAFRSALGVDPQWAEAATALGDVYYHLMPSAAPLDTLAESSFRQAVEIDSNFTPPAFHLAEIAIRRGDRPAAEVLLNRMQRRGADASWTRHLAIMLHCLTGGLGPAEWRDIAKASADEALLAAHALAAGARQPRCAAAGFRAVLTADRVPLGTVWAAALGLHGVLAALGKSDEAARLLDSARTTISTRALAYGLIDVYADSAFRSVAEHAEAFGLSTYGPDYERARLQSSWAFGVWEAWKGNRASVEAIARRVSAQADTARTAVATLAAASLRAHVARLRGDTAAALAAFASLPAVAPRDSLSWNFLEPLAPDRLIYADMLLSRGRAREALDVASVFDHQEPIAFLAFVRPSLVLRARAAEQLGKSALAASFRARLAALNKNR